MSCTCQNCDREYSIDFIVPDEVWEKIKPEGKARGAGLLCGACICDKLMALPKGEYAAFKITII